MREEMNQQGEYNSWITEVKGKIRSTQMKAIMAVNSALIHFYWELGKMIAEKIESSHWGDKILEQVSADLKAEFPEMKGLSRSNLAYTKQFYLFYSAQFVQQPVGQLQKPNSEFVQYPVGQISWSHNILIFSKSRNIKEANFYLAKTIENGWSRDTLALQIKSDLYGRQGKAVNNFNNTLPALQSELAEQTLKDPYIFDFLTLSESFKEKDIEDQLVNHIRKFLLELGKGFAFVGQQYQLEIAENDYYIDLLFYHIKLKCYVVIELKNTKFIPEYAGKLNFYLSAVDTLLKEEDDKPTIGIILCRDKNNVEAEFALRDINKPMGVSEFELTTVLPNELKSSLPTIEELERNLLANN